MKLFHLLLSGILISNQTLAQVPITAVTTSNSVAPTSFTYSDGGNTYNWGVSPNNNRVFVDGFTAGGLNYTYASFLTGNVRLRRVNNSNISGNFTLVWAEATTAGSVFNMLPEYQNDMESFFNNRAYNKGTDNFFDNTSGNSNNIERLDWIISGGYSTLTPGRVGFSIFERGATGAHDPFCIAAITSLDAMGDPASYGNIVRVTTGNYGDPGPTVTYRILKATNPSNLLDAGTANQNRGGVIISLQSLGVSASQTIYGYSLFSNDLPGSATPANLVNVNNTTYFPINTGNPGGIDLIAVMGIYIETAVLSTNQLSLNATCKQNRVALNWQVSQDEPGNLYQIESSPDGRSFTALTVLPSNGSANNARYSYIDVLNDPSLTLVHYRIKCIKPSGAFQYSEVIPVRQSVNQSPIQIFPNPSTQTAWISLTSAATDRVSIEVYNVSGSLLYQQNQVIQPGMNTLPLPNSDKLPPGNYSISILFPRGERKQLKWVKQ